MGERIGIIVLAAGRSTRFRHGGTSKLLSTIRETPIVRAAVTAAVAADIGEVVVVTGHLAGDVAAALEGMPVRLVHEPAFADGMAASLRRGVRTLAGTDALMVALGDQPGMRPEAYRRVAGRWRATGAAIVVPRYAGSVGTAHPPLFAANLFDELLALEGDVGARAVIARDPARVADEALDWPAPEDVDTITDLEALRAAAPPTPEDPRTGDSE